ALDRLLAGPTIWIDLDSFARDRALGTDAVAEIGSSKSLVVLPVADSRIAMLPAAWGRLRSRIGQMLDGLHAARPDLPGIGLEQLRKGEKPVLPAPLFTAVLRRLVEAGEAVLDRTWVRRPHHEVKFSGEEEHIWALILPRLAGEPYRPPRVRDIAKAM